MVKILVVEDDVNMSKLLKTILVRAGYEVLTAGNPSEAFQVMDSHTIELFVTDVMMPETDGFAFTRQLRDGGIKAPILMVTAKHLMEDKHKGFLAGTDDYMVKPVDENEMLLRIKALLRRSQIVHERKLKIGDVLLEYDSLRVIRKDETVTLPPKEFYLLYKLLSYPNRIFTRLQIMDDIWGMENESDDSTINVHITRLRKKLEHFDEFELKAIRGIGYKAVIKA